MLSSCVLSSWWDGCKADPFKSYHFIDCYEKWSSFKLSYNEIYDKINVRFNIEHKYYSIEAAMFLCRMQAANDLDKFYELAVKNEDVGYDWKGLLFPDDFFFPRVATYPGITGILITSDHDFDDSHPAGTSLNDIFNAHYFSYTQFLGDVDHSDVAPGDPTLGRTEKRCSEIDNGELSVIHPYHFYLYPAHAPTVWKDRHLLTVTLTDENGVEHSASVEMDFDSL